MDFYFLLGFGPGAGSDVSSPRLVGVFYTGGFSLQIFFHFPVCGACIAIPGVEGKDCYFLFC